MSPINLLAIVILIGLGVFVVTNVAVAVWVLWKGFDR